MRRAAVTIAAAAVALAACNQKAAEQPEGNEGQPAKLTAESPPIPPPRTGPDAKTPFGKAEDAVDPKSPAAARQVVRHYGALIEEGRWGEAEKLWSGTDAAAKLASELNRFRDLYLESGSPTNTEGAAGSIYVTVPVTFYETDQENRSFRRSAHIILRRVNDVPGSTEEQRRWHIERVDWGPTP
jgi:hypothetical protein